MSWSAEPAPLRAKPSKKRGVEELDPQRYEHELQTVRCRVNSGVAPPRRAKRMIDEPTLMEALKRTRISSAPGELRMKNDVNSLQRTELVRQGCVAVIQIGPNALILYVDDQRYVVAVPQKYPFEPPSVRRLKAGDEHVELPILEGWSAIYTLEDIAAALFERSQMKRAIKYEMSHHHGNLFNPEVLNQESSVEELEDAMSM